MRTNTTNNGADIWTPAAIRQAYQRCADSGHFFDRATMRWFGDTMRSFGTTTIDGAVFLYRKRNASVNVFGEWKTAGIPGEFFNAWKWNPELCELSCCDLATTDLIFTKLYNR